MRDANESLEWPVVSGQSPVVILNCSVFVIKMFATDN
jgi:hypothetical protein